MRLTATALVLLGASSAVASSSQSPFAASRVSDTERYGGHQVWRVDWSALPRSTQSHILEALINDPTLDIFRSTPSSLDISLHPSALPSLHSLLPPSSTPFAILSPSLPELLASASTLAAPSSQSEWNMSDLSTPFHDSYHSLSDLYSFGDALVDAFPGVVEGFEVGQSCEGRAIRGWRARLRSNESDGGDGYAEGFKRKGKKGGKKGKTEDSRELEIIVQSGQHAREWVGPSSALYFLHSLLHAASTDPESETARLLRSFTFTIIPTINPDGYVYSHDHSRLWRKNRQAFDDSDCIGIDLNANWGYKWAPSRRASPCSDNFPGHSAFESLETRAMADYLANGTSVDPVSGEKRERRARAFVDLHSYGQLFMFPFAHSCEDFPPDAEMLMEAALGVAKTMRSQFGEPYQAGQACDVTYRAPGDAIDYAYGSTDIRWSYSAELRDTGTYGFLLPPHLIRPAAEEVSHGLLYLAKFIYNLEIAG